MENLNNEIRNLISSSGHSCSKAVLEMVSQQKQQSDVSTNSRLYTLRTRFNSFNMGKLSKTNNVRAMHELLCKPVSVKIKKLPELELNKTSKIRHKIQKNKIKQINKMTKGKAKFKQNQVVSQLHGNKNVQPQPVSACETVTSNNHNSSSEDLLNSIKQPYIKLHRIDEVINKIAQTFAKVIPNKEYNTNVHEGHIKKTQTEINGKPSNIDIDECLEKNNSETTTSNPDLDDTLQPNHNDTSDSETDINKNASNRTFRRKRKIFCDDDDDDDESDNVYKVSSGNTKTLKLNISEKETKDCVANKEVNAVNIRPVSVTKPLQKLNVSDKLHNPSNEQNSRCGNVNKTQQQDNVSTYVPSNVIRSTERNVFQTLNNEDIQNQIEESFISDKDLKAKYNLFKDLRVCLVKFDDIKCSTVNKYLDLEDELLIRKYMNELNNSGCANVQRFLLDNEMEFEEENEKIDIVEFMKDAPILNSNVSEVLENTRIKQESDLNNQEISEEVSSVYSAESTPSSPIKSVAKASKSSGVIENIIKAGQSGDRLHSPMVSEVYFPNKELSITSIRQCSPKKTSNSVKIMDSESVQTNAYNITFSKKPENNEKVLISGRKMFVTKIHAQTVNIINPKVNTKKNISACHSTIVSPYKLRKPVDKEDNNHSISYKCIVCDCVFESYSILQNHLIKHRQKQNNIPSNTPEESISVHSENSENLQKTVPCTSEFKKTESLQLCEQSTSQTTSSSNAHERNKPQTKGTSTQDLQKKKNYFSKQRSKFIDTLWKPSECTICSKIFPTATDLAAHIFLHTEHDLQKAYETAKQKNSNKDEETKSEKSKQATKQSDNNKKIMLTTEKPSEAVNKQEKLPVVQQSSGSLRTIVSIVTTSTTATTSTIATTSTTATTSTIATTSTTSTIATTSTTATTTVPSSTTITVTDTLNINKSPVASGNSSKELQLPSIKSKLKKRKEKKSFKICNCHKETEINNNCLKIEIVLLCHTCNVLFRSMNCFDNHYDLPEYELCRADRAHSSRTPNLLCVTCSKMFPSVQDVRRHLESHARVKRNFTMDFRCKICKVLFIGIGALFYVHWSKHLQDPYWKADETTFPKNSVVHSQPNQDGDTSNTSKENFIQVAEYICNKCKIPFVTETDLKIHNLKCVTSNNSCNSNAERSLEIEVHCSLCNDVFTEKLTFYRHVRNKHNFISEPQSVCVSLTLIKTAYICNVCMEVSESMEDFEDHWLKHSTATVYFTCTYCTKSYCNGLNAFLEHARMHQVNVKQYVLSCKVDYENTEFICKHCNIGFQSEKDFNEHNIIHKLNQVQNYKDDQVQNQKDSVLHPKKNQISDLSTITELVGEKQKEDNTSQLTEQRNEVHPVSTDKDEDRQKLINILEGTDDDSEPELTIDWIEIPKEEDKLSEKGRDKEKQTALDNELNTSSIVQRPTVLKSSTVNTSIKDVVQTPSQASSKNIVPTYSQTNTENPKRNVLKIPVVTIEDKSEISKQPECLNVQSTENKNAFDSTKSQEEPVALKKNSPPRPRQGFLRVRSLAELTNQTKSVQAEQSKSPEPSNFIVLHNPLIFAKCVTPATTSVITNQQSKQTQTHANQDKSLGDVMQNSTSAYHKNLPASNITRTALGTSPFVQKSVNASTTAAAGCSKAQNQQVRDATPRFTSIPSCINIPNNTRGINPLTWYLPSPQIIAASKNTFIHNGQRVVAEKRCNDDNLMTTGQATTINNNQNSKEYQTTSPIISYQYPCFVATNSNNGNEMQQKSQQMGINPLGEAPSFYYKNPVSSTGGMSIVINQTTAAVQNVPTINVLRQEQQHGEGTTILDHSYAQQTQDLSNFSASNNVYQMVNEQEIPNVETSASYKVNLQPQILICVYCPKTVYFSSIELLELHMNMNHNFVCNTCGLRLYSFDKLNIHKLKHNFI
ncbi:uncharacterized protein LOC117609256 isoform X1 [Osmia lignaria lignaria]|uniref:uncharacterized protein LOC117609256 isoform X1 n=1 Tax=Osmia lignaria lignaria TaxID=1437193 RepID=UPI00402BEA9F